MGNVHHRTHTIHTCIHTCIHIDIYTRTHTHHEQVWESDCSNYKGCHPWFFGGDDPQSLALMMDHWEHTYHHPYPVASNR